MRQEDVDLVVETFLKREDVAKYAHVASFEEIKENDFNLNIPRYVDTFEEEDPVDLVAVSQELGDINRDIEQSEADLLAMISDLAVTDDSKVIIESAKQLLGGHHE
ncbi:MAG: SAM-dependent methyltransferase [Tetragenococcus koreensis]|nr:SAM-dependent methyltransferase [Tetragenococcus koreensis]